MPKRSLDIGREDPNMPWDKTQRKTERSHEENQERAYIAASRRADRSIEARVQSARMASEIHKKRTGRGFRISEEIVTKEEMYEEEEDDFPRSYRLLGPNMQTASPKMNLKVEAYLSNRMAMSALVARTNDEWKENEINRLFAQSFPNAGQQARRLSQQLSNNSAYPGRAAQNETSPVPSMSPVSPASPTFQQANYPPRTNQYGQGRLPSDAAVSEMGHHDGRGSTSSHSTPDTPVMAPPQGYDTTVQPSSPMRFGYGGDSVFTSELPPEARMLMAGMTLPNNQPQGMFAQEWEEQMPYMDPSAMAPPMKTEPAFHDGLYDNDTMEPMKWDPMGQPAQMDESWDTFIDNDMWGADQ